MTSIPDKCIIFYTYLNLFCHKDAKTLRYSLVITILGGTLCLGALVAMILMHKGAESHI